MERSQLQEESQSHDPESEFSTLLVVEANVARGSGIVRNA